MPGHEAGIKPQRMIKRTRQYHFFFAMNRDFLVANNGTERALRHCAVFQKIANGFPTEWEAELYAYIGSVIETARGRSISALEVIHLTLAGMPLERYPSGLN